MSEKVCMTHNLRNAYSKSSDPFSDLQIEAMHNAGMLDTTEENDKHSRLRAARAKRYRTAKEAAAAMGVPYGTYSGHEAGSRGFNEEDAERYAKFFRVSAEWIMFGRGEEESNNVVGVAGYISAGGSIETGDEQLDASGNLFEISVPFPVPSDAIAFVVKGESMWPRYDPDDVIICSRPSSDPQQLVGWEAAVSTPEGNRYLKRLMEGTKRGLYSLESHNAAPIRDVAVAWASEVLGLVRARRWQRVSNAQRKRLIESSAKGGER